MTNDIFTREDCEFLQRNKALEVRRACVDLLQPPPERLAWRLARVVRMAPTGTAGVVKIPVGPHRTNAFRAWRRAAVLMLPSARFLFPVSAFQSVIR